MKALLTSAALALCATAAHAAETQAQKWQPTLEMEGRTNSDRSLFSPKLLVPLAQDNDSLLFTDIRTRLDDHNSEEYNVGVGFRQLQDGWIYGGYVFADYLNSANGFSYWQGTAGAEMLSENWDLRVNGYLPEGEKNLVGGGGGISGITIDSGGNFIMTSGGSARERALPGFDGEVGYKLPISMMDLRVFGGAYYFDASEFDSVSGPKARVEMTLGHDHLPTLPNGVEFTLGVQYQNDGPRENTTTALAQVRIPFGGDGRGETQTTLTPLERRMTNFIERDVDIVTPVRHTSPITEAAVVRLNNQEYSKIQTTIDANTVDINAAIISAGTNSLVKIDGAAGTINTSANITPLAGQAIVGANSTLSGRGLTTNRTGTVILPGTRPTLDAHTGTSDMFMLDTATANNIAIKGLNIQDSASMQRGVFVNGTSGAGHHILLEDLNISGAGLHNIDVAFGASDVTMRQITANGGVTGIKVFQTADVSVSQATLINNEIGMDINNSDRFSVTDTTINNPTNYALYLSNVRSSSGSVTVSGAPVNCQALGTNTGTSISVNNGASTCP